MSGLRGVRSWSIVSLIYVSVRRASIALVWGALSGLLPGALGAAPVSGSATPLAIGAVLPDVVLHGLNGPSRPLSAYRGRPLIINVWASWCGPCRAEIGSLERLAWREDVGQFAVIGISTDDYPEQARGFLKLTNATISHFIDKNLVMEHLLGATHLPLTVFVDAKGRIVKRIYGARAWDGSDSRQLIIATLKTRR